MLKKKSKKKFNKKAGKNSKSFGPRNKKPFGKRRRDPNEPKIVHNGKNFVVAHKPAGWTVYQEDATHNLKTYVETKLDKKLLPVHRLDKSTCGLVLFSLNWRHSQRMIDLFKNKKVTKKYLALVHGVTPEVLKIDVPLKKHKEQGTELAVTHLKTLEQYEIRLKDEDRFYSLVELELETGRYHQLRRHLKAVKHPIVGDELYGNSWNNDVFKEKFNIKRSLLSAVFLQFMDPIDKIKHEFEGKPDPDFAAMIRRFQG